MSLDKKKKERLPDPVLTEAQKELAAGYVGLAKKLAKRASQRYHVGYGEMLSEAYYRLTRSAAWYDPGHGAKFVTYAWRAIALGLHKRALELKPQECLKKPALGPGSLAFEPVDQAAGLPDEIVARKELVAMRIRQVRERVTQTQWGILWQHYAEGEGYPVVAKRFGVSKGDLAKKVRALLRRLCGRFAAHDSVF